MPNPRPTWPSRVDSIHTRRRSVRESGWIGWFLAKKWSGLGRTHIWLKLARFGQNLMNLAVFSEISLDLARSDWGIPQMMEIGSLLLVESVRLVENRFQCKDTCQPTYWNQVCDFENHCWPITGVGSGSFQIRSVSMVGGSSPRVILDNPKQWWVWSRGDELFWGNFGEK